MIDWYQLSVIITSIINILIGIIHFCTTCILSMKKVISPIDKIKDEESLLN